MKRICLFLFLALAAAGGCEGGKETTDPSQLIVGKWQEIARGNHMYPTLPPNGHIIEFLADGTHLCFSDNGSVLQARRYRVGDGYVYYDSGKAPDGHTYRHTFAGAYTLRLDHVDGAIQMSGFTPTFNIYRRIR
jgi:hypothetical protein